MLLLSLAAPALPQQIATSPGPEAVAVTVYRDPNRGSDDTMQLEWLNGFALITETRSIAIPAGEADIRFEGVAGGIIPESAIVTGLPEGVAEKNQDAWLLSPASLLDRSLGRRVHLRRTSAATGEVREHEAVIRSGADGAVVLQTPEGFEALRCTGFNETIVYPEVPAGLSAKPTLSVRTRSTQAGRATVTLSYLATGFDWQANYIARLEPAGDRLDLFAWVTLANGDETSFVRANTQTVAGRLNREEADRPIEPRGEPLNLQCWPAGRTSDIAIESDITLYQRAPPPPSAPPPPPMAMAAGEEIVVTGSRVRRAQQEELGDLKLYRIPEPVTVAAQSQKQVAMLERSGVKVTEIYRSEISTETAEDLQVTHILKTRNRVAEGLGLPLPAGGVVLFAKGHERPVLIGEGAIGDHAVGEDVEIEFGEASGIVARVEELPEPDDAKEEIDDYLLTVTNDHARPVSFEAVIQADAVDAGSERLQRRNGRPLWTVTVPANGARTLRFRVKEED